jgi:very-short-patch-repair endonuclease
LGTVPGFALSNRVVVANFSYAKLPMVRDLDRAEDEIARHSLLSSIAGDLGSRDEVRARQAAAEAQNVRPVPPPDDEFLILDADNSQSRVIAAAVAGSDLVVIGPPGTGKSQTISNLIATLAARGKSVLFVAEKRAAIEAVVERLQKRELGDLVLDLHDGTSNRRRVAETLQQALEATGRALDPDVTRLHRQLERRREELEAYASQLHARTAPWGISAFEAQSRILGIPTQCRTGVRYRGAELDSMTPEVVTEAIEDTRRFFELGGLRASQTVAPWSTAYARRLLTDANAVSQALGGLDDIRRDLPKLLADVRQACGRANLPEPATLEGVRHAVRLLNEVNSLLRDFRPEIYETNLDAVAKALDPADSNALVKVLASLLNGSYRRARDEVRALALRPGTPDDHLLAAVRTASRTQMEWRAVAPGSQPTAIDAEHLVDGLTRVNTGLVALRDATGIEVQDVVPLDTLEVWLADLDADRSLVARFPELHRLDAEVRAAGFGASLDEAVGRTRPPGPLRRFATQQATVDGEGETLSLGHFEAEEAALSVEHAWLASVHERLSLDQPALASFDGDAQDAAVSEFGAVDRAHIDVTSRRVLREWAERAVATRDAYPEQAAQVARQASLKRRHMPIRELFDRASTVLTAVKPCWVMSPLVVAQVLPARPCFDVVIFDEASQILPADAACSLLRGAQAVVAGDPHQLPPTTFFMSSNEEAEEEETEEDEDPEVAAEVGAAADRELTQGQESILDVMRALLPPPLGTRVLSWHYRSKDERLITFSNAQESLYGWSLTTFPGALPGDAINHVLVEHTPVASSQLNSSPDEVARVVELVIEHATTRPDESVGVIALGITHSERIAEALRLAALNNTALAAIMADEREEPLFVKNLERVQGDERDAIILTVGYGRTADGRMRYNFGPINQEGGQRRLNVAITRARRRMTVVSSFAGGEMDPARLRSVGAVMLRDYLLYAESGGKNLGMRALQKPPLTAFERDVKGQLEARGLTVVPQFGASGYWIDFAVMHPERPDEPLLAIEADGSQYYAAAGARDRDRLRRAHLERLGWRFHRIWSTDWFRERDAEVGRAVAAYKAALQPEPEPGAAPATLFDVPDQEEMWLPPDIEGDDSKREPWPRVPRGHAINDYAPSQIRAVVRWVKSDGRLYTEEELLTETMRALGFMVRGKRIVEAIQRAIVLERGV